MSVEIVMPKLSDTMEEGTILKWLKHEGDEVSRGEVLAEVETDKADMELEAAEEGVLREIKVGEGESAAVGAVIALVDEKGAARATGAPASERGAPTAASAATPTRPAPPAGRATPARREAPAARPASDAGTGPAGSPASGADEGTNVREVRPRSASGVAPAPRSSEPRSAGPITAGDGDGEVRVKASPSARKIAAERGIDLRSVRGSGPDGRIVKEDVAATGSGAEATRPRVEVAAHDQVRSHPTPAPEPAGHVSERHELSRMRQSIARRMSESFREVPHFYVTAEIDMTEAVRLKDALQASELYATPISYTHMILKATALALRRHPRLNASYRESAIEMHADINIGMAVAVEDGLIVPVLQRVDERSLADIAIEAHRLVEQAHQGRFGRDDLSGGTFTVSNMGMLDIEHFTAVINPPQAAILAIGAIKERPVARGGRLAVARTMRVTVSCDHRIIDGVVAGRFLEELKRLLENPIILVVRER
jgi:pyruvate dehydrogenase E2 component (dihydrolipoamide acetyltransferase)